MRMILCILTPSKTSSEVHVTQCFEVIFEVIFFHKWVHLSECTLFHICLKRCALCIQMQCWWFIGWVWQRLAHDRGSVYGRKRADRFDLCFFSLTSTRCLSHSARQTPRCGMLSEPILSVHGSEKHCPRLGQTEVDRFHWYVCHWWGWGWGMSEERQRCILMVSWWNKQLEGKRVG